MRPQVTGYLKQAATHQTVDTSTWKQYYRNVNGVVINFDAERVERGRVSDKKEEQGSRGWQTGTQGHLKVV